MGRIIKPSGASRTPLAGLTCSRAALASGGAASLPQALLLVVSEAAFQPLQARSKKQLHQNTQSLLALVG